MTGRASTSRAANPGPDRIGMTCAAKQWHNTIEAAEKAAAHLRERDVKRGDRSSVRVYECPECGGYHLTRKGGK